MAAIRDRMEDHARRTTVRYTQAIVNAGREAGASLEHPHGQLLGIPFVPGEIAEEEAGFRRFGESCLLCTMAEAERQARAPGRDRRRARCWWCARTGAGRPTRCSSCRAPTRCTSRTPHRPTWWPWDEPSVTRSSLLRTKVGDAAYNLVFHTAPHHHDGPFHWHVHIVPRLTSLAGFEQGTGVMINIVAPELAARHLTG